MKTITSARNRPAAVSTPRFARSLERRALRLRRASRLAGLSLAALIAFAAAPPERVLSAEGMLGKALTDYVGVGNLRTYKVRFTKQTWPGEVLTSSVKVTAKRKEDGANLVDLECTLANQDGEVKVASGRKTVVCGTRRLVMSCTRLTTAGSLSSTPFFRASDIICA